MATKSSSQVSTRLESKEQTTSVATVFATEPNPQLQLQIHCQSLLSTFLSAKQFHMSELN